tara:strand:- start:4066 stop:5082 length:1017 start_codon:yes stop_codon:yes gene_type:complete
MEIKQDKVLVTGASGYIALHCISELLKQGYKVKGSLRDMSKEPLIRDYIKFDNEISNLEFCKLDLLNDKGWNEAFSDCDYVMHIASPFVIEEPKNEKELIEPALQGTLRALNAANNNNIKKFILTSSMASVAYGHSSKICDNNNWTDTTKNVGAYVKSKTIAERAAWQFIKDNNVSFSLTTIHPGMVFGPLLSNEIKGASVNLIANMISGKFPALPEIFFTIVDVRDIAKLHINSLKNENSDNKRILATSENGIAFSEISRILRKLGFEKSPKNIIPNQVINSLAVFNKEMKITSNMIQRGFYSVDLSDTISIFNWEPISLEQTLFDMTNSIKRILNK